MTLVTPYNDPKGFASLLMFGLRMEVKGDYEACVILGFRRLVLTILVRILMKTTHKNKEQPVPSLVTNLDTFAFIVRTHTCDFIGVSKLSCELGLCFQM